MALVKYNNNSISAITAASGLSSGAMTLIKSQTASSSSTISFVDGTSDVVLDSTYPIYLFKFINIHPSGDGVRLQFQGNVAGGSGYNETMTTTAFRAFHNEGGSDTGLEYVAGSDLAQATGFQQLTGSVGNGNDESCAGELWLFSPSSTTYVKHFISRASVYEGSNYAMEVNVGGYCNVTAAIDAVQFKFDSGNIDAGTFKLYGIKDS